MERFIANAIHVAERMPVLNFESWYFCMEVIFFDSSAHAFIQEQDTDTKAKIALLLDALSCHSYQLRMPYSKPLGKGLFELRVVATVNVRIIYMFYKGNCVVLHWFVKKTMEIPAKDMLIARVRQKRLK